MFESVAGRVWALLTLGLFLALGTVAIGQPSGNQSGNYADLKKNFEALPFQKKQELLSGARAPQNAEDKKFIEAAAQWYVFRVTLQVAIDNPKDMEKLHEELEDKLINPLLKERAKNGVFVDQLGKELVKCFKDVLSKDFAEKRISILNAAIMLPPVAKLKQEDFGDFLVNLLNDNARHDVIKLYAAKALREYFPVSMVREDAGDDPKDAKFKRGKERLQALTDFIARKEAGTDKDVIRYMRREAVASLAQAGVPYVYANRKKGELEGPAAYEILRVLVRGKDAYDPPTSLSERVEAALGLCHLKAPLGDADYDPSLAVYAVGLCFNDYMLKYSEDFQNIVGRKRLNGFKVDGPDVKIPTEAWRIQSERFKIAAKELVANTKGTPAYANAVSLEKNVSVFADVIKGYNRVPDERVEFAKLVEKMAPKTGQLYKLKGPQIDPKSLSGAAPMEE